MEGHGALENARKKYYGQQGAQLHRVKETNRLKRPHRRDQTVLFTTTPDAMLHKSSNLHTYQLLRSLLNQMREVTSDNEEDLKNSSKTSSGRFWMERKRQIFR